MISPVFFSNSIDSNNLYKYEPSFLNFVIARKIDGIASLNEYAIFDFLTNYYGIPINRRRLREYLSKFFYVNQAGNYALFGNQKRAMDLTSQFKKELFQLEWENEEKIYKALNDRFLKFKQFDVNGAAKYVLTLIKISNNLTTDETLSTYFDLVANYDSYYLSVDKAIDSVGAAYRELPPSIVLRNGILKKILFSNGIDSVGKLCDCSVNFVLTAFLSDLDFSLKGLACLNDENRSNFPRKIASVYESLKERELDVISLRNGFSGEALTLEEIGERYGCTRERIRQIEVKADKKLFAKRASVQNILYAMFFELAKVEKRYITTEMVEDYLNSDLCSKYVLHMISIFDLPIKYDSDLKIIYNSDLTSIEELTGEMETVCGDFIASADYLHLNQFEKSVVDMRYKLLRGGVYAKRSYSPKDLVASLLNEYFPDGYRIGNPSDYQILTQKFKEKFGEGEECPSSRSVGAMVDRIDFCQIDKGTYKSKDNCASLPEELVDRITNYVLMNGPTVFYSSIFAKFKNELGELGVRNYFYLKGLIDPLFPSEFKTKRNYVSTSDNIISSYDAILLFMKGFNGEFALQDLRDKFPGVKDYTFYNVLYDEVDNGLVWSSGKTFIYLSKVFIAEDVKVRFKAFIENLFSSMSTGTLSSGKIYARMSFVDKSLLSSLKIANDTFSTFSLIRALYPNDYGFNRPMISKDRNEQVTSYNLIVNYVRGLDSFNSRAVNGYVARMNMRGLYSYLMFMEDMSDEFVQVNIETMVKKEKLPIGRDVLDEITSLITMILNRFGKLDTRHFSGYQMFPTLEYHWNKYLLAGIVRTYLSDKFEVTNTSNSYDTTDFIIGGNRNE